MVEYSPPPANIEHLNWAQRYMQKGQLDQQDYVYLFIFVLAYFCARPYIEKGFKWWMAPKEVAEGEAAQKEYIQSKARAKIGANSIRGSKEKKEEESEVIPEVQVPTTSGANVTEKKGKVLNRKQKVAFAEEKTEEDKLMDWDDEPARQTVDGDKGDVMAWLDKWDK